MSAGRLMIMDATDLERMTLSDAELESVAWNEEGRDVELRLRHAGTIAASRVVSTITCRWAEALEVKLAFPQGRGGHPLTWGGAFRHLPDGTWSVCLDFGGTGEIRLTCADIEVSVDHIPVKP
jgi:hypothetical protein